MLDSWYGKIAARGDGDNEGLGTGCVVIGGGEGGGRLIALYIHVHARVYVAMVTTTCRIVSFIGSIDRCVHLTRTLHTL